MPGTFKRDEASLLDVTARAWLRGLRPAASVGDDVLWPRAMAGGRAAATALTLLVFVLAVTLDDLRMFRFSAAFAGAIVAVLVFAFTPPLFAGRLLSRALEDAPEHPGTALESAVVRRRALLGASIALLVVWLVYFSSGRTPRW